MSRAWNDLDFNSLSVLQAFRYSRGLAARVNFSEMERSKHSAQDLRERWLEIEEVRLVSDLRLMHAKVDELYNAVQQLKRRHDEGAILRYSDQAALTDDIQRVDEIYLWYVKLKERAGRE
jgi:hypothetical protein